MSDRTFRLIFDGKKGGLVKGSSPSSAAKKASKKLSAETGKTSFKFELQETTKDSKKKVYGPYKTKVKMAGGAPKNTQELLQYQEQQLQKITDELRRILKIQKEYIGKSDNNINKEINKLTQNVRFNEEESNKILNNIQKKKPKINSLKLLDLVIARKIILNKIELLKKELWDTPLEQYFPKGPVISKNSLERQLQDLYKLKLELKKEFNHIPFELYNNSQIRHKIANRLIEIKKRDIQKYAENIANQIIIRKKGETFLKNSGYQKLKNKLVKKIIDKEASINLNTLSDPNRGTILELIHKVGNNEETISV